MSEQRPPDRPFRKNGRTPPNGGGMRVGRGLFGWVLFIGLAIVLFMLLQSTRPNNTKIPFTDFETYLTDGKVKSFTIDGDDVTGELKPAYNLPGSGGSSTLFSPSYPAGTFSAGSGYLAHLMTERGDAQGTAQNQSNLLINILVPLVPWLLIF